MALVRDIIFDVDGTLSDTDDYYARKIAPWLPRSLFRDPAHTARRLVMWIESPGNALLGFADRVGIDDEMVAVIDWLYRHVPSSRQVVATLITLRQPVQWAVFAALIWLAWDTTAARQGKAERTLAS